MRRLLDLPHHELRALLRAGVPVWLPVNPVEYHGPHLSLHNDRLVAAGLARDVFERLRPTLGDVPLLLAADLEVGVEPCPGPGTRATAFSTVRRLVVDACERLAELGAQRVVLLTFHGAPLHNLAVQAGVQALRRRGVTAVAPLGVILDDLVEQRTEAIVPAFDGVPDPEVRAALIEGIPLDFHGGFLETSLALHYAPETVSEEHRRLPACPEIQPDRALAAAARLARRMGRERLARELGFLAHGLGWYALRPFPGYTGRPDLATPEAGASIAEVFARHLADHVGAVFEGAAPISPIVPWLGPATLGGRIGRVKIPLEEIATSE